MNKFHDRRESNRIDLENINAFFKQCDISVSSSDCDLDITIINISPRGMKVKLNSEEDFNKLELNSEVFIRGCIFNDSIGFLSSQKAVAVWKENPIAGLRFTPELDIDDETIHQMLSK